MNLTFITCPRSDPTTEVNLSSLASLFFNQTCLDTHMHLQFEMWPCPAYNVQDYFAIFEDWLRFEMTVVSLFSVIASAAMMQVGGIPAPLRGSYGSIVIFWIWVFIQFFQIVLMATSIAFVTVSYITVFDIVDECLYEGPFGYSLLSVVSAASFPFQPIMLSKILTILLYYHGLYAASVAWQMTRGRGMGNREKECIKGLGCAPPPTEHARASVRHTPRARIATRKPTL